MAIIIRSVANNFYIGQDVSVNNLTNLPIYGTIERADNYFALLLHGMRWQDTTRDMKLRALVSATRQIDQLNFIGQKANDSQPLQFPRGTDTLVPEDIEKAAYELAAVLLKGIDPDTERDNLYKNSQVFGQLRTDYNRTAVPMYILHGIPSATAWNLLLPYLDERRGLLICRVN
jgi:hypothetical protein